jgi:poly(A) polymerase
MCRADPIKGSDIDTLVVAPRQVKREDFFELFPTILKRNVPAKDIGNMTAVPDSFVPIIKMELCGIDIDLIFARIPTLNSVPLNLDLRDTRLLEGMDQAEIKSVNGTRVTDEILGLVPQPKTFRTALRAIKLWAQRRAIYANILGFPGGVAWAMLVARVCQLYPTATGSTIIQKFFFIIGQWSWPSPIMLKAIETGKEKTWNPQIYAGDKKNLMPVITPAYPSMCATFNISKSGKSIILKELKRGEGVVKKIIEGKLPWNALFDRHTFFTQDHRYYLNVISSSNDKDAALAWSGLVESKVRILVMKLEEQADMIELARPFIKGYERVHKVKTDAEAEEVKKGSVKYQVRETQTTDETNDPIRVAAAETGTVVGDAKEAKDVKNAQAKTNGTNELQTIYTTTFYVGIELTAAATKNLDISSAIGFFKNTCTSWGNWKEELHEVNVVPIKW